MRVSGIPVKYQQTTAVCAQSAKPIFWGVVMDILWRDAAWESSVPITAAIGELVWTSAGVLRVVAAAQGVHGRLVWLVDTEALQWVSLLAQMGGTNSAIELRQIGLVDITSCCGSP